MAISAAAEWFYRTDGSDANGGGWDPSISGAGTNYADAAAALATWDGSGTTLATAGAGATTITSNIGPFTSDVVGNALRINAGGSNFVAGWYFIVSVTNVHNVVLDRSPTPSGSGSGGRGALGGAGLLPSNNVFPVQPGNTIWIRGSGSDDGVTVDYDFSAGYWTSLFTPADVGHWIRVKGYNGRPHLQGPGLTLYNSIQVIFDHLKVSTKTSGTSNESFGVIFGNETVLEDCIVETNGVDISAALNVMAIRSEIRNTGSPVGSLVNSYALIRNESVINASLIECEVYGGRADGIRHTSFTMTILRSIIHGHAGHGIGFAGGSGGGNRQIIYYCDVYGNGGDGLHLVDSDHGDVVVRGTIFSANGGYGLNCSVGGQHGFDWNAFQGNSSGAYSSADLAGPNDLTLTGDPYTNAAGRDFTLNTTAGAGAALRQLVSQIGAQ